MPPMSHGSALPAPEHDENGRKPRRAQRGHQVSRHPVGDLAPRRDLPRLPIGARAHLFVTVSHWAMTLRLGVNLRTGMRLGWGYEESALGGMQGTWARMLAAISPAGTLLGINIITLHVWSAFLLILVAGVYVVYLLRSGATRKLKITRADFRKLAAGLKSGFFKSKPALWSANVLVYWISFAMIAVLTVSGFVLYRLDLGLAPLLGGYDLARLMHAVVGYLLIPYTILHATLQWCFGRFWTIFKAQVWWPHVRAGLIGLAIASPIAAGAYMLDDVTETLTAPKLARGLAAPALDGDPGDPAWAGVSPVKIRTAKATNSPGHVTDVTVKAVHDGTYVYFQFQWNDPDVSYKRYPLVKTDQGWKVLQTAFANADENHYYEDKLSMYVTKVANGSCASTCHLGVGPSAEKNEKHGLHYTAKGEYGDIWHWKSVRTNPVGAPLGEPGYVDDQYFGPRTPVKPGERYTGGYYGDPDEGGGYAYNFTKLDPKKPLNETLVVPKFLPPTGPVTTNPAAATSEQGRTWWIHKSEAIPYSAEADTYPVGSLIPNIVISPLTGDRGDVRGKAEWKDGRWTLETRRVLDTGSKYDVAFVPGEAVYVTVATYNRTQTRHGEHIKPVRVVLEK